MRSRKRAPFRARCASCRRKSRASGHRLVGIKHDQRMSDLEGFSGYEPGQDLSTGQPPRSAAAGCLIGRVDASTTRVESHGHDFGSATTLTFRLLGPDRRVRDVQLRGRTISGTVHDGDWVEVRERERAGRLEVDTLLNLTTGAQVTVSGSSTSIGARVFKVLFLVVFFSILLVFVFVALGMFGVVDLWPFSEDGPLGGFSG